jgi:hypothetical protein
MEELKRSIAAQGVAQPIVVRPLPAGTYEVVECRTYPKGPKEAAKVTWRIHDRRCVDGWGWITKDADSACRRLFSRHYSKYKAIIP